MTAKNEIAQGTRFAFGQNWQRFLQYLSEPRINQAVKDLQALLRVETLAGKIFLDIGSGSGLMSLAAHRLGARVISFDYDPQSVACTRYLHAHYASASPDWQIMEGSILDPAFLQSLPAADIVYSWGVLHHTGQMWQALGNVIALVKPGGLLAIAIYNDQGGGSRRWWHIKKAYNTLPRALKPLVLLPALLRLWGPTSLIDLVRGKPFHTWRNYHSSRGMSPWHDVVDWVGGFPFEVASVDAIFSFYRDHGFSLTNLISVGGGHGCNQFVFQKR